MPRFIFSICPLRLDARLQSTTKKRNRQLTNLACKEIHVLVEEPIVELQKVIRPSFGGEESRTLRFVSTLGLDLSMHDVKIVKPTMISKNLRQIPNQALREGTQEWASAMAAMRVPVYLYDPDYDLLAQQYATMTDRKSTSQQRGSALQKFAFFLFNSCGDLFRVEAEEYSSEVYDPDLLVWMNQVYHFRCRDSYFTVECKNWSKSIFKSVARDISYEAKDGAYSLQVLFTMSRLESGALKVFHDLRHRGVLTLVFDKNDIASLCVGCNRVNFISLFYRKYVNAINWKKL